MNRIEIMGESLKWLTQTLISQWETLRDSGHQVLKMHWTCLITEALVKTFIHSQQLLKLEQDSVIRMESVSKKQQVRDNTITNNETKELQEK